MLNLHNLQIFLDNFLLRTCVPEVGRSFAHHVTQDCTVLTLLHSNGALKYFILLCVQLVYTGYVLWGMTIPLAFFVVAIFFQRLMLHGLPVKESMVSCLLPMGPFGASAVPPLLSFILLLHVFSAKRQGTYCRQAAGKGCHAPTHKLPAPSLHCCTRVFQPSGLGASQQPVNNFHPAFPDLPFFSSNCSSYPALNFPAACMSSTSRM